MSSYCHIVLDCLFVVLNVFFNFVLPFDGEIKLYIYTDRIYWYKS